MWLQIGTIFWRTILDWIGHLKCHRRTWSFRFPVCDSTKSKNDGSLILLHYLHVKVKQKENQKYLIMTCNHIRESIQYISLLIAWWQFLWTTVTAVAFAHSKWGFLGVVLLSLNPSFCLFCRKKKYLATL